MEMDDQSSFAGDMPISLLCPSLNKRQTSSRKRYSRRERSWYCNIDDTEIRSFGDSRKEKWTKIVTFNKDL